MALTTFRDTIRRIVPSWLTGFWGYRLLYSIAIQLDAMGDAVSYGLRLRFPNQYSPESLALIGRERGIIRGFEEPDASYAARLNRWMDDWRTAGNPYTLMRQLQGYLTGHAVKIRLVNNAGAWYTLNADGSTEYHKDTNWNWDGNAALWSRFWVIIYPPADLWVQGHTYGDGSTWGSGYTYGSTATGEQVATVRLIIEQWTPPHARCINIIVAFDPGSFDPFGTAPPLPDGTWGLAANRDPSAIYWDGGA